MLKVRRFYLRLLLCLFLSLSVIFSSTSAVSASITTDYSSHIFNYNVNGEMGYNSAESTYPIEYEMDNGVKYAYYYRIFNAQYLFTTSTDRYGYKIQFNNNQYNSNNGNSFVQWVRPVVGTYNDIYSAKGTLVSDKIFDMTTRQSDFVWITSDNAEEEIYVALLFRVRQFENSSGTQSNPLAQFSGQLNVYVYGYGYEDYQEEISLSIEEQNRISQQQLQEAQEQTQLQEDMKTELEDQTQLQEDMKSELEEQTESQKSFFGSFFDNLKNLVIGIFVPSSDELSSLFDRLNQFFSDKFGFLYYPFDFLVRLFDTFLHSPDNASTSLTLPGFSIMGYTVWSDVSYDLASDDNVVFVFSIVRICTGSLLGLAFVNYLRNFFDKRFGGGGS